MIIRTSDFVSAKYYVIFASKTGLKKTTSKNDRRSQIKIKKNNFYRINLNYFIGNLNEQNMYSCGYLKRYKKRLEIDSKLGVKKIKF